MLYRIGVDVGGTNTDAALARAIQSRPDKTTENKPLVEVITSCKSPTTSDVTTGICNAIQGILNKTEVLRSDILSVNIGTTHFINAIVQIDRTKLARVAVLRLCGPFARELPPFSEFPTQLRAALEGHVGYLSGGLEINARPIGPIDEAEVRRHAKLIQDSGVHTVAVVGIFSNMDIADVTQEQKVKSILEECIPDVDVVCSRDMGSGGFVERENAAIINASILALARETIGGFQAAVASLGLDCPLYLTQNDGTIMSAQAASATPIKTFSSGATNSLTGAVFLAGLHSLTSTVNLETSQVIMVDVGGTSADFAALSSSGFPRQSPAIVKVGGVRTAFSMPEVLSFGLGGGSRVHEDEEGNVTVGPDSVGYQLATSARCFGGSTLTATDIVVASSNADVGIKPQWDSPPSAEVVKKARADMLKTLQKGVDRMKASDLDVVLLLVGGGSIIQIDEMEKVKACVRPPFYDAANAVGAAIAKVSGDVDRICSPGSGAYQEMVDNLRVDAIKQAVKNGALPSSIKIVQQDILPLAYSDGNMVRAVVKAVGELEWRRQDFEMPVFVTTTRAPVLNNEPPVQIVQYAHEYDPLTDSDLLNYVPKVLKSTGEWFVSATDLAFIGEGCAILGVGGGGTVRPTYLNCLDRLKEYPDRRMRIIEPDALADDAQIAPLAFVGYTLLPFFNVKMSDNPVLHNRSPTVSDERLLGNGEIPASAALLAKYLGIKGFDGLMGPEIGGSNGMISLSAGAYMDLPVVDADFLGRAFPKIDMSLPYIFNKSVPWPATMTDARGNSLVIGQCEDPARFETLARSNAIELGLYSAMTLNPISGEIIKGYCPRRTLSAAWFMGREVFLSRIAKTSVVKSILSSVPGGVDLYFGKVVGFSRIEKGGWNMGTATIMECNEDGEQVDSSAQPLVIQYQNEYLYAALVNPDKSLEPVVTTPDLITVLDQTGSALGTNELRYGLLVHVIAMPAHRLWKTEEGMMAANPAAFGFNIPYVEMKSKWEEPESVIQKYGV